MTFQYYELMGWEIYLLDEQDHVIQKDLLNKDDLKPGMTIAVPTLYGYKKMTVCDDLKHAETEAYIASIEFDKDDRHCWTSFFCDNKKAIKKLKIK